MKKKIKFIVEETFKTKDTHSRKNKLEELLTNIILESEIEK